MPSHNLKIAKECGCPSAKRKKIFFSSLKKLNLVENQKEIVVIIASFVPY